MNEKKWTDDERDEAFDRGMETMQRVALELYRRGREPLLEELEEARARNADMRAMLEQVTRERDEARAEVEHAYREGGALYEAKIAEREAFRSGAEAMREACAEACRPILRSMASRAELAKTIRALPIPEEK